MNEGRGEMGGGPGGPGGPGGSAQMPEGMGGYTARFRSIVQKECSIGKVSELTSYPRIPINKELWPYHVNS